MPNQTQIYPFLAGGAGGGAGLDPVDGGLTLPFMPLGFDGLGLGGGFGSFCGISSLLYSF